MLDANTTRLIAVTQTYFAAIYAVALWDWIVMLPTEYKRIWKAPRSLVKVLYYCNRYYTLGNLILTLYGFNGSFTAAQCLKFYKWEPGLAMLTTLFAEAILVIRTYALWGKSKIILAILVPAFCAEVAVLTFSVTQFHPVPTQDLNDPTSTGACIAGGGPGGHDWSMAYWVSPIVMDTVMMCLTTARSFQLHQRGINSSVLSTFVRDGVIYFVVVFVVNLINTIFYALPTQALQAVNSPMSLLMTSIMCSHIILSLRNEEQSAMESVSKDWQANTFLRNKQHNKSGATSNSTSHDICAVVQPLPILSTPKVIHHPYANFASGDGGYFTEKHHDHLDDQKNSGDLELGQLGRRDSQDEAEGVKFGSVTAATTTNAIVTTKDKVVVSAIRVDVHTGVTVEDGMEDEFVPGSPR